MKVALVGLAGAAGALSRYAIGLAIGVRSFPWATLGINVTGSFVFGLVLTTAAERRWSTTVTTPLVVGFLGAYTTFSTFSFEAYLLARTNRAGTAAAYIAASVVLGLLAAAGGYLLGTRGLP
jgi:CrcB protein